VSQVSREVDCAFSLRGRPVELPCEPTIESLFSSTATKFLGRRRVRYAWLYRKLGLVPPTQSVFDIFPILF
jgi:hypothetical protein